MDQRRAEGPAPRPNGEMTEPLTLGQATKLWPEEVDPEFGRPYGDLGIDEALPWLQNARQARRCEPRAAPLRGLSPRPSSANGDAARRGQRCWNSEAGEL